MTRARMTQWLLAGVAAIVLSVGGADLAFAQGHPAKGKSGVAKGHGAKLGKKGKPAAAKLGKPDKKDKLDRKGKAKHELKADDKAAKLEKKADKKAAKLEKKADEKAGNVDEKADEADTQKGKGLALGKNPMGEKHKHLRRLAKLERLGEIAEKVENPELTNKVNLLRDKEMRRHQEAMARLTQKAATKAAQ